MESKDHTVIITGGATGIGFALAAKFHGNGNRVIIAGRNPSALSRAEQALPGVETVQCDIVNPGDRRRLLSAYPDTNILVNNAGVQVNGEFGDLDEASIAGEIAINFTAPVLLCRLFLPALLRRQAAAVVNLSSALAIVPKSSTAVYCATKAALHSFSSSLRRQLANTPVKVFDIVAPLVDTAMTSGRGKGKISPERLAEAFWAGFLCDRQELLIGKSAMLQTMSRISPALARKIVDRAAS